MIRTAATSITFLMLTAGAASAGAEYERADYGDPASEAEWSYSGIDYSVGGYDTARLVPEASMSDSPYVIDASPAADAPLTYAAPAPDLSYAVQPETIIPADLAGGYVVTSYGPGLTLDAPDAATVLRARLRDLRARLELADADGGLTGRDRAHLAEGIREIRHAFRDMSDNDGVIDVRETQVLNAMIDRHEARIARQRDAGLSAYEPI